MYMRMCICNKKGRTITRAHVFARDEDWDIHTYTIASVKIPQLRDFASLLRPRDTPTWTPEVENSHASPCLRTGVAYLAHSSVQKASTVRSMRESRPPSAMIPSTPDAARRTAVSTASTVHANTLLPR